MAKKAWRERYIKDIYQSILNCRYRNDKIEFDSIKYGFPIGKQKILFRDSNRYLRNSKVPV